MDRRPYIKMDEGLRSEAEASRRYKLKPLFCFFVVVFFLGLRLIENSETLSI